MKYFTNCKNLDELKAEFRRLTKIHHPDLGSWLWISGNTFPHREELKRAGCRWSKSKKLWYWRHWEDSFGWHRGTATMAKIRERYGSQILGRGETPEALPA